MKRQPERVKLVVRPNRWDSRETRLEDILSSLLRRLREVHPEWFDGSDESLTTLDVRTSALRAQRELAKPAHADLDGRIRHPFVRWWRGRRVSV